MRRNAPLITPSLANWIQDRINAGLMLRQRLRRWRNIKPAFNLQRLAFASWHETV